MVYGGGTYQEILEAEKRKENVEPETSGNGEKLNESKVHVQTKKLLIHGVRSKKGRLFG